MAVQFDASTQFDQQMPLGIVATAFQTKIVATSEGQVVLLIAHTPIGAQCYLLPPEMIERQFIPQLQTAAMQARTGLVISKEVTP